MCKYEDDGSVILKTFVVTTAVPDRACYNVNSIIILSTISLNEVGGGIRVSSDNAAAPHVTSVFAKLLL